jgi:hypothetical protein
MSKGLDESAVDILSAVEHAELSRRRIEPIPLTASKE